MAARRKTAAKKTRASTRGARSSASRPSTPQPSTRQLRAIELASEALLRAREGGREYLRRRDVLVRALRRAGFSDASIRARLGWLSRRRVAAAPPTPTPRQARAIERARLAFLNLLTPRAWFRPRQQAAWEREHDRRRAALVASLAAAGYGPASIRARVGWVTRQREARRDVVAAMHEVEAGTATLDLTAKRAWVRESDERFLSFMDRVQDELQLEYSEAINEWFSPKI